MILNGLTSIDPGNLPSDRVRIRSNQAQIPFKLASTQPKSLAFAITFWGLRDSPNTKSQVPSGAIHHSTLCSPYYQPKNRVTGACAHLCRVPWRSCVRTTTMVQGLPDCGERYKNESRAGLAPLVHN